MQLKNILFTVIVFTLGVGAASAYASIHNAFSTPVYTDGYELPAQLYSDITGKAIERPSPSSHVQENQINVYSDRVVLDLQNVVYAKFTNTNSMDPVLDESAHALETVPKTDEDIQEGDIVAYRNACTGTGTVIHRVLKKSEDQLGTYYIVKGDNNPSADPCKVRFDDIRSVVVGIIY